MLLWLHPPFGSERKYPIQINLSNAVCRQGTSRATASADQWPAMIGANPERADGLGVWPNVFMTIIWKVQWTSLSYLYLSLECTACCVSYQSMAVFFSPAKTKGCQTLSTGIRHSTHRFQGSHKAWDFWLLTDQWYQSISHVYCWSPQ